MYSIHDFSSVKEVLIVAYCCVQFAFQRRTKMTAPRPTSELQWDISVNLPSVLQNGSTVPSMRFMPFIALNAEAWVIKFHPLQQPECQ